MEQISLLVYHINVSLFSLKIKKNEGM